MPFGHVGDGNLHFNCQSPPGWDKTRFMRAWRGDQRRRLRSRGGLWRLDLGRARHRPLKVDELAHYRSKIELDTMRSIKRALDPQNLMNPGKIVRV